MMEYPESTLLQMIGRAGRPQYDTKGVAVILTHMRNVVSFFLVIQLIFLFYVLLKCKTHIHISGSLLTINPLLFL